MLIKYQTGKLVCAVLIATGMLFTNKIAFAQQGSPAGALITNFDSLMITAPPAALGLNPFYKKYADAYGIPVVSSEKVPNTALLVARDVINYMLLNRPDIRKELVRRRSRLLIMAQTEMETDLPERSDWKKPTRDDRRLTPGEREKYDKPGGIASMTDKQYWNNRARGMGGNITSCAEENILGYPGTKYYGENILVHEFSHNIMSAMSAADPALLQEIEAAYKAAKEKGMYKGEYAINTVAEYWAESTQWWFFSNFEFNDGTVKVQSAEDIKTYDPAMYSILARVYAGNHIPADVYYGRNIKK
ncbi:hypothetical protein SAMN05216464_102443 [Mucilaginibacter pineti]|uniref:Glycoside hydrolase n=1 Tax=Mucilaginibacter pineti TaxID=1391627 RepID=A0A1G6X913_9SPHI|nr:glycoside hydrolase [Mucilaginibacter pineti]SDD74568.1 hypothetical protein SAMN05216464_102443 [Mucilaginibacter pineti]